MSPGPKKLLIITPAFHDYYVAFSQAFAYLGYRVRVCKYDEFATWPAKFHNKLRFELPTKFGKNTLEQRRTWSTQRAMGALRSTDPDEVLIIRGDLLGEAVFQDLESRRIPYAVWFYDEFSRMEKHSVDMSRIPAVASYSSLDTEALKLKGINSHHIPLGFDSLSLYSPGGNRNEVSFIGARYPNRENLLVELHQLGVPVRAFGRDWSRDFRDQIRTWGERRPDIPSGRDLDRRQAYGVMEGSLSTLNMHYNQDGFTMRTFEAAGVGAVQLIDRADVSEMYAPGEEVLVFSDAVEAAEEIAKIRLDGRRARRIRSAAQKRTLAEHTLVHRAKVLSEIFSVA